MRLFAVTVMYHTVNSLEDTEALQSDLNTILKWADTWQMQFNAKKCTVMRLTQKNYRQYLHIQYSR